MTRQDILDTMRRAAAANGGVTPGTSQLADLGIPQSVWQKYWARIGDAQREAGLVPNKPQTSHPEEDALAKLAALARDLGSFPTYRDIVVKHEQERSFPSPRVYRRLGPKGPLARRLAEYARTHPGHDDVAAICDPHITSVRSPELAGTVQFGSVYLLKGPGRRYKIGRTNAFGRRRRELAIQLPFDTRKVHIIETDDPEGVEAYWHQRFASKRINSEWFELTATDVAAFKRWKRLR